MSVRRFFSIVLLSICSVAVVADEELPEIEFLEYLGLWEETDEDWLMFSDPVNVDNRADNNADDIADKKDQQRSDPVPEGEESMEKADEI